MSAACLVDRRTVHNELKALIKLKQKQADGRKLESAEIALQKIKLEDAEVADSKARD